MGQCREQRPRLFRLRVCGEHDLARRAQLPLQLRRSAEGGQRPFGNDEDLVADGLHLGEDMGAENDSVALSKLLDQISDLDDLNGVKADGRLIQNDDLRPAEQRLRNAHALPVALGKRGNSAASNRLNARARHGIGDLYRQLRSTQALGLPYKAQVFHWCFIQIKRRLLGEIADKPFGLFRLIKNIVAADAHMPLRCGKAAGHDIHGGGLPRSIGAEEAVDLTAFDGNAQIGNCRMLAVSLAQVFNFDQRNTPSFFFGCPHCRCPT